MTSGKHSAIKPWEDLMIADDYMFKLVMRHPNICKRLVPLHYSVVTVTCTLSVTSAYKIKHLN